MDMGLSGKGALVAGASAGIGLAIARGLAAEGAHVAMLARREDILRREAEALQVEAGVPVLPLVGDLTDADQVRACVASAAAEWNGIEVLVTNAGGPPAGRFLDLDPEAFEAAFRLIFQSALWLCQEVVPRMIEAGRGGRIVMVTSTSVKEPLEGLVLSNSIRPGVAGLAKSLANELGAHGIRVNVVCPGFADTDRLEELAESVSQEEGRSVEEVLGGWASRSPLGRIGRPEEIADLAVYLASERSSYVTGTVVAADGGRSRGLL